MQENDKISEFELKPTIVFQHIENIPIVVGCPAVVFALNHPNRGTCAVWAGWVLKAWEDDNHNVVRFETKDAYYVFESGGTTASVECFA